MTTPAEVLAICAAIAAHPRCALAAKRLALELAEAIQGGAEIPPGVADALARILTRAERAGTIH